MAHKRLYGYFRFKDKNGKEHFRKPTPRQRKNILIYYLRRRSGRCMRVADLAAAFCVSERTIQKLLKELETENIIRRVPVYGESGVQKASKYIYTGDKSRLTGKEPSIDKIYDPSNPMKLRDFDWKGYFLIRALTDKPVTVIPNAGEILQELKRQGNNLNQAVRRCYFYPNEKEEVLSAAFECKKAYRALYSAIGGN